MSAERGQAWSRLGEPWDLLVVGGGITGAGILLEAAQRGLRALLVEQRDFAWGTSSRSSKLVHGGLRYLRQGAFALTAAAVRERERLLREAPGLVDPLGFLFPGWERDRGTRRLWGLGLRLYDLMAGRRTHSWHDREAFALLAPGLERPGLEGGYSYADAQVDDARLVLRVLDEARARGALALNYTEVTGLLRERGRVRGALLRDRLTDQVAEVQGVAVINATGAWADRLRGELGARARMRPLRGSHLSFPAWRLPVAQAVCLLHPVDRRPMFVMPWEGVTLVGTTDLDHELPLDQEPRISPGETDYLLDGLARGFPDLALGPGDVLASFAGVRPVVGTGQRQPSRETRDHVLWEEDGLLTVTGGKLTTFRVIARQALGALRRRLPARPTGPGPLLASAAGPAPPAGLSRESLRRLLGRHGPRAAAIVADARPGELETIPGTRTLWAELRQAARAEQVVHLDDLLLRRLRLGLLLPEGGRALLPRVREACQPELGWSDERWRAEEQAYLQLWQRSYALP